MKLAGLKVDRRNFLVRAGSAMLATVIGKPAAALAGPAGRPVRVSAHIGTLFPPIRLAARLSRSARSYEIIDNHGPGGVIDVAIFPSGGPDGGQGLMKDKDVAHIQRTVAGILADEFGYRAAAVEVDPGPAFWYPFAGRRAVCSRLSIALL